MPPYWLGASRADGAFDCMVVKVVVSDLSEWLGEENTLFSPPSFDPLFAPTVLLVPAFDCPASE